MSVIRIAGIEEESIVDGEGIRYVIFTQGCSHNCEGCHNPSTHSFTDGYDVNSDDILKQILKNKYLSGVTLSGGDPFFRSEQLIPLVKELRKNNINIWAYTGFTMEQFLKFKNSEDTDLRVTKYMIQLLKLVDILVDGRFDIKKRSLEERFKGSTNQRIIDVKKSLRKNDIVLYNLQS